MSENKEIIEKVFGLREESTQGLIADNDSPEVLEIKVDEADIALYEKTWDGENS